MITFKVTKRIPTWKTGETVFTSFDLPLRKVQSTEGSKCILKQEACWTEGGLCTLSMMNGIGVFLDGCVSASVTRHLAEYIHFNSSEL